ncbi:MAG TPA: hypothetical protein VGE52_10070, partial [Pirellulales bacterium]
DPGVHRFRAQVAGKPPRLLACLGLLLTLFGCGPGGAPASVSGKVVVGDRPAPGVYVILHPTDAAKKKNTRMGKTGPDGAFAITAPDRGEYAVTLVWPKITVHLGESIEGDDQFKGAYGDPAKPHSKVQVQSADFAVPPIVLKRP